MKIKEFHKDYRWAEFSGPGGTVLGVGEEGAECTVKSGSNAVVTIAVKDLDEAIAHFVKKGATLVGEVVEVPGHVKMQTFLDLDRNTLQLVQKFKG